MSEYSNSTKSLFGLSQQHSLKKRAGETNSAQPDYIKDDSNPIPVARFKGSDKLLRIDVKPVTVIGFFGPSGSGKTTAMNSVASRCYDKGRNLINLADSDLQFSNYNNHNGVSKQLIDKMGLAPNEERHSIPSKTLIPKFYFDMMREEDMVGDPPSFAEPFSFGFHQVSQSEIKALLSQGLASKQQKKIERLVQMVEINQDTTFNDFYDALEDLDVHGSAKKPLKTNIKTLEDSNLISSRFSKSGSDIVSILNEGSVVGVGLKGFDMVLDEDDMWKAEFYSRKVLDIIIQKRLSGGLDCSLLGVLPEAHHLMPAGGGSDLAKRLKRNFTYYKRRTDFPFILDSQSPYQLPGLNDDHDILGELNYIFVGREKDGKTLDPKGFKKILKSMNIVQNANSGKCNRWLERLNDVGWREFLYVRPGMEEASEAPIVEFLAPLVSNP